MKAARFVGPRKIELIEVEKPEMEAGKALVRMERAAICGSEMPFFLGQRPIPYPLAPGAPGHECVGVVEDSECADVSPGDRVLALPSGPGGLQEYLLLGPANLLTLPDGHPPEILLMTQLLGTVVHCWRKLDNLIGKDVVIVGQGPVGLLFTAMTYYAGVRRIIVTDLLDYRLETARRMGATDLVNADRTDVTAAVREMTQGRMADMAIEAVGRQSTIHQCMDLVPRGGTVVFFGVPDKDAASDEMFPFEFVTFFRKELRLIASVGPDPVADHRLALALIAQGRIDVSPLITHRVPFSDIQRGYEMAATKEDDPIKIIIDFDRTA